MSEQVLDLTLRIAEQHIPEFGTIREELWADRFDADGQIDQEHAQRMASVRRLLGELIARVRFDEARKAVYPLPDDIPELNWSGLAPLDTVFASAMSPGPFGLMVRLTSAAQRNNVRTQANALAGVTTTDVSMLSPTQWWASNSGNYPGATQATWGILGDYAVSGGAWADRMWKAFHILVQVDGARDKHEQRKSNLQDRIQSIAVARRERS